jgi:2-oxoglutarate dehydrogenase E1 component
MYIYICRYIYIYIYRFPNAELVWVQEEPKNMGAWAYVKPRFDTILREGGIVRDPIRYIGRKPSASAATGGYKNHVQEQKEFIDRALTFYESYMYM